MLSLKDLVILVIYVLGKFPRTSFVDPPDGFDAGSHYLFIMDAVDKLSDLLNSLQDLESNCSVMIFIAQDVDDTGTRGFLEAILENALTSFYLGNKYYKIMT